MKSTSLFVSIVLSIMIDAQATVLTVPGSYSTIQSAINASANGDTIAVSPGTYFENINFKGKKVLLTSLYYLSADTSYITTTVINGSTPVNPDTASCVLFISGEDTASVLQGFTITAGTGTKWLDIHGAGTYREGGGILIELCSPKIIHNVIRNNFATNTVGVSGAGGGGIRIGDGNPVICSNAILYNQGRYGAGIVLNYTGCILTNNIIASNTGGQNYYGGSGIWISSNLGTTPKRIENNTIVNNTSSLAAASGTGGISVWSAANVVIRNNIIYGNTPSTQIKNISSTPQVTYSDVQGGYTGTGNINAAPLLDPVSYVLMTGSPCIDAGDTAAAFNDIEDSGNPGFALFPSQATLRNDMGAYGGGCASLIPSAQNTTGVSENLPEENSLSIFPNPASGLISISYQPKTAHLQFEIIDVMGRTIATSFQKQVDVSKLPSGLYLLKITDGDLHFAKRFIKE